MMEIKKAALYAALFGAVGSFSPAASAAVSVDSVLGEGNLEFSYGGGSSSISTYFSGPFGVQPASGIGGTGSVGVADLALTTNVSGAGTSLLRIDYSLSNLSLSESFSLGMIAMVDPNGGDPFAGDLDQPTVNFPAVLGSREPVAYGVDDFFGSLNAKVLGGSLDNSNNCGAACDVLYALEWDLGLLAPGDSVSISVGLSDDGSSLSSRNLVAQLDSGGLATDPSLTFSGSLAAVPLPAPALLLGSGLAGLLGFARRRVSGV